MADTTEKKTYLVNVESNLNKYAADAANAAKEVEKLEAENKALLKSSTASAEEIEKSNSALRSAKKEYTDAKKLVDLQTQANNSNINSRKQLNAIVTLEQRRLGELANTYTINSKGVRELSQDYIIQVKRLKEAKDAVIAYDKAQSDGRSSVGLYSEAIQGAIGKFALLPGPIGQAAGAVKTFGTQLKALLLNPLALAITAIILALKGLFDVFKSTATGAGKLKDVMASIHAILDVLRNRVVSVIEGFKALFHGDFKKAASSFGDAVSSVATELAAAASAAAEFSRQQRQLSKELAFHISEEAQEQNLIQKYLFLAKDRTQTDKDRLDFLNEAIRLGKDKAAKEVEYAQRQFDIDVKNAALKAQIDSKTLSDWIKMNADQQALALEGSEKLQKAFNLLGGADAVKALEESEAKVIEADTAFYEHNKRAASQISSLILEMQKDKQAVIDAAREAAEKANVEMEKAKGNLNKELEDYRKFISERHKIDQAEVEKKKQDAITEAEFKKEQQMINAQNLLDIQTLNNENEFALKRQALEIEHQDALTAAEKSGADVNLINQKYSLKQIELAELENDAKLQLASQFASNLATIFGEGSAIGKAAAIAAVTIETYRGAMAAYVGMIEAIPGPIGIIAGVVAAAAAVATGIINVKKIMAVKTPGKSGGGGSAPTSITNSAVRGPSPQANIFQLPGLSQPQLNALPNQNPLTAQDIATEIGKLPAPVVTVEDINAKTVAKNKVDVRGNV